MNLSLETVAAVVSVAVAVGSFRLEVIKDFARQYDPRDRGMRYFKAPEMPGMAERRRKDLEKQVIAV